MKPSIPLSKFAQSEISRDPDSYVLVSRIIWVVPGLSWLLGLVISDYKQLFSPWLWIPIGIAVLVDAIHIPRAIISKRRILKANEADYARSHALADILGRFKVAADSRGVTEHSIPGSWKVFFVDNQPTYKLGLDLGSVLSGRMKGVLTPDLLENSAVVRLVDGARMLSVILLPPTVIRRNFADIVERGMGHVSKDSHCWNVLNAFRDEVDPSSSHEQVINRLMLSSMPGEQRLTVEVFGTEMGEGVVIGSALAIDEGDQTVFLPSKYFEELTSCLKEELVS